MKVVLLGTGWPMPDPERGNMSQVVMIDEEPLLFDCGERTSTNLMRSGINPLRINNLFITHHHWDHISDYGYLCISTWNFGRKEPFRVFGPKGTKEMSDALFNQAYTLDTSFIKEILLDSIPKHITNRPNPELQLDVKDIDDGYVLDNGSWKVTARLVEHLPGVPCFGFRIDSKYGSVAISGDTNPCEAIISLAKNVDVLVHECAFPDEVLQDRSMQGHSGPTGVGIVAQESGAKKVVVTHLPPFTGSETVLEMASMYLGSYTGPQMLAKMTTDISKKYDGSIILGEDNMEIPVE